VTECGTGQKAAAMPYDIDPYTVATSGMDEAQCHYSLQSARDPLDVGMCGLQTPPRCNQKTVRELQHKLLKFVSTELRGGGRKIPMAWHNAYTDCGDLDGCGLPGAPPPATNVRTTCRPQAQQHNVRLGDRSRDLALRCVFCAMQGVPDTIVQVRAPSHRQSMPTTALIISSCVRHRCSRALRLEQPNSPPLSLWGMSQKLAIVR
jgi:hypothetical protein